MYVNDDQFIEFINAVTHPHSRFNSAEQMYYAQELDSFLRQDGFQVMISKHISGEPIYEVMRYCDGKNEAIKNLVFASCGEKPDIVIEDALSNNIQIIDNDGSCLFYTLPITKGLTWHDLIVWWNKGNPEYALEAQQQLVQRLLQSLDSEPEVLFLRTYYNYLHILGDYELPALIPQVYCHYDPKSAKMRNGQVYVHQRMDFLMLLPNNQRVIIEIDGKQHYSVDGRASPELYARMVKDDRTLKLYGYEVYRFGGYEFYENNAEDNIREFIKLLFKRYGI